MEYPQQSAEDIADKAEYALEEAAYGIDDDHAAYLGLGLAEGA